MLEVLKQQSNPDVQEKSVTLAELSDVFGNKRQKMSLLLELIGVACANDEYHVNEKDLIAQYANQLGVSQEKLQELENWVQKQIDLSKQAEQLINN